MNTDLENIRALTAIAALQEVLGVPILCDNGSSQDFRSKVAAAEIDKLVKLYD